MRDIPWVRVLVEGVVIVGSILLAFGIDAWWDRSREADEERAVLIGLEEDFTDIRDRLNQWADFNRLGERLVGQLLSDSLVDLDRAVADSALTFSILVNVLDQGGPLEALMASGRLEIIQSHEIRTQLAKWPDWLEDIHTNDLSARQSAMTNISPYLTSRGWPEFDLTDCGALLCFASAAMPGHYLAMAEDPEFRALMNMRKLSLRLRAADHAERVPEAERLLELIREELRARW